MTLELITIPISHYCEKARWALGRAGLPYVERAHLQVLHYIPAKRAGGGRTVPVLVTEQGPICDSAEILAWASARGAALYPKDEAQRRAVREVERPFDEVLGPQGRLWMYQHFLSCWPVVKKYGAAGVPAWQRRFMPVIKPGMSLFIRRYLGVTEQAARVAEDDVDRIFDQVAERLERSEGEFLMGPSFCAADLTFAALAAPMVLPQQYGVPMPTLAEAPESARGKIETWRAHPAGQYALRLFAQERHVPARSA